MKCERCGFDNSVEEVSTDPCWMYQLQGSEVKSELFDPRKIPEGWYDSPKAAKAALVPKAEAPKIEAPKKVDGRSKAARLAKARENDDSTGFNQ